MKVNYFSHSLRAFILTICLTTWLTPSLSWSEDTDNQLETLGFSTSSGEQLVATSRIPRPASQIAENVTVITAADIRALNAHTLADILNSVPGLQLQQSGGPGIPAITYIQSANFIYSQVFIDGVSLSNLSSNYPDVTSTPAQIIERVEIIKGAASSAWGSALGGVINVITKSPETRRDISGSVSASIGDRTTADTRAELSGTSGKLGYYLSSGYLGSEGLRPTMEIDSNHTYAKLTYELPRQGQMWGTFSYYNTSMGDFYAPMQPYDLKEHTDIHQLIASLGIRYTLTTELELELAGRHSSTNFSQSWFNASDDKTWYGRPGLPTASSQERVTGAGAKLIWRMGNGLLVIGSDYNNQEISSNTSDNRTVSPFKNEVNRWGLYLNDSFTFGPVSIAPDIRMDHTETNGDQVSSSFGATWQLTENSLLRAYIGRGFSLPQLTAIYRPTAKILTTQIGAESTAVPYLWLKGTLFRNLTWGENIEQQLALGSEVEVRAVPVLNTSLGVGYTFTETTLTSDGSRVTPDKARHTVQLALRYDDKTYRAMLAGRHINWNAPPDANAKYGGLIWDLHLGATVLKRENSYLELFLSGHNLFNGDLYNSQLFPNVGRWFDGGLRVNF